MNDMVTGSDLDMSSHSDSYDVLDRTTNTRVYFSQLKLRIRLGLLLSFVVPLAALSAYFHFQFNFTLKETAKLNLIVISESQRNTVDLFLQERVVNIFSLFHSLEFSLTPSNHIMENYLQNLRRVSDAFIDVGFLNAKGIQIGYAGPFPNLQDKDYTDEKWFLALMRQDRNHFVSDIYLGFRNKPHFTIAVKQRIDGKPYVMRSTLDPDKFYMFLRTINHGKDVNSALINDQGSYQLVDPGQGKLSGLSDFIPANLTGSGFQEIKKNGDRILVAYAWLKEVPWALIVREPLHIAHAQMYQSRRIMIIGSILIIAIIAMTIWFTTSKLINKAQDGAEKHEELQLQFLHASKLAAVGELATGVAHEINNPLAIIMASNGVIRDMLDPELALDDSPENIRKELDNIDMAILRARGITRQLLDYGRKNPPQPVLCDLNQIIDEVLGGFKEREFEVENIEIIRNYNNDLPKILVDPDQIRQVFFNLINNAGDAITGSGTITISTISDEKEIHVTIADTGCGMTFEQTKKIFAPFYTNKEGGKGTGLGLSVSLSIVKSMDGSINVQSMPGAGSSFTVVLPISKTERGGNGGKRNGK
jgi:two-component system NtrC family sensor kinase